MTMCPDAKVSILKTILMVFKEVSLEMQVLSF